MHIYNVKEDKFYDEELKILADSATGKVVAIGNDCESIITRNFGVPAGMEMFEPVVNGRIIEFKKAQLMYKFIIRKYLKKSFFKQTVGLMLRDEYTELEIKATTDAMYMAGFKEVIVIQKSALVDFENKTTDETMRILAGYYKNMHMILEI